MRSTYRTAVVLAGLIFIGAPTSPGQANQASPDQNADGQSLGDVARAHRQKEQAKNAKPASKVITDEDLPDHAAPAEETAEARHDDPPPRTTSAENKMAEGDRWKSRIQAQKSQIASLQSQIDRVESSIHFVEANRYRYGVEYNQLQMQKQEQAQKMRTDLDNQKHQLEEMQESCRRAGFGSAVYDP